MNKKEQAAFDAAIREARLHRALRWSDAKVIEPDIPVPTEGHTTGWTFNSYGDGRVERAWSESVSHGTGEYQQWHRNRSATQRGRALYSTKALALRAMRCEMERRFAETLTKVDAAIEEASKEGVMP